MNKYELEKLRPFIRGILQAELLECFIEGGASTPTEASRILNKDDSLCRRSWRKLKAEAAKHGVDIDVGMSGESVPAGFQLDKSTVHIKDGEMIQRWDRVSAEKEMAQQAALDAMHSLASEIPPTPKVKTPKVRKDDLINVYTISDLHIGLYAWPRESGESYSTAEAQNCLWKCYSDMLDRMPDAESCVIVNLGDYLHWDGLLSQTPASHNVLDGDSRYQKLAEVAIALQTWMIEKALGKHKTVHVINAEGNHDEAGSAWLRVAMQAIWAKNKRVTFDTSPAPYYAYQFGRTMFAWHHGHKRKDADLGAYFAAEPKFREMWGQCSHTYIHTGHLHSKSVTELPGSTVERHNTLAARSSYEARGGWQSKRAATAICYDNKGHEKSRVTVVPEI